MRREGIRGAERRGRPGKTTTSDAAAEQRPDLVCRDFAAERPNELRVADLTQVPLDDHGVKQSLGSVGDALDNALAVSWVDSLKTELIADRAWRTRGQLELAIVEYIGWFNHLRVHSSLSYTPPAEFEQRQLEQLQLPLTGRIPDNGSVADASLKAANGLRTRPGSTTGVDFAADGLTLPKAAPARTA